MTKLLYFICKLPTHVAFTLQKRIRVRHGWEKIKTLIISSQFLSIYIQRKGNFPSFFLQQNRKRTPSLSLVLAQFNAYLKHCPKELNEEWYQKKNKESAKITTLGGRRFGTCGVVGKKMEFQS